MKRHCAREDDSAPVIPVPTGVQRGASAVAVVLLLLLAIPVNAQWLELKTRPTPPQLGEITFAATIAAELDADIVGRASEDDVARASVSVRHLARTLLLTETGDATHDSILIIRGMKLRERLATIDRALERIRRDHARAPSDIAAAVELLREFNVSVERRLSRSDSLDEDKVAALLAPLDAAVAFEGAPQKPRFEELPGRAGADDELRAILIEIADFFDRGWAFAELRPQIARRHELLSESLGYLAAVSDARWLSASQRSQALDRVRHALAVFRDPQRRHEGERMLAALLAEAEFLRAVTLLAENRSRRADLDSFRNALSRVHSTWGFSTSNYDLDRLIERLDWLTAIVNRMNRFRAIDRDDTPHELRRLRVLVVEAYLTAERSLLRNLEALVAQQRSTAADSALAAVLAEHRRLLDDVERLQRMSRWTDAITLIRPASAVKFGDQVRRLANQLGDPVRRVDAAYAMDRVESEVARFWPMPFEDELRLRSRVADLATGGRYRDLLDAIDAQRDHWAKELAEHGPGLSRPHAQRLEALHQLLAAMNDVSELLRDENAATRLNLHDEWWTPQDVPRVAVERVLPHLHHACRAVTEDDDQRLLRELRAIEREGALARLMGRRLAQGDPAPMNRSDLALICRYAIEAVHAHSLERIDETREMWHFAGRMATIAMGKQ